MRAAADGSHVHHEPIDEGGVQLNPGSIATSTPQTFLVASSPAYPFRLRSHPSQTRDGCALLTDPDPPGSSRLDAYGASRTGSSRTPSRLARRTRAVWQCRRVPALSGPLPPSPAFPGSGCPQLRQAAATAHRQGLSPHSDSSRFVAHEQIIEPAMRIITGPTVQFGLDLPYPTLRPKQRELRFIGVHRRPPGIPASFLPTCWPPSPCARLSRARTTTGPPPRPTAIGRQRTRPPPDRLPGGEGDRGRFPRSPGIDR